VTVTSDAVWVANYQDETVTSIDQRSGHSVTIAVDGHPTGVVEHRGTIWVWTVEGRIVPVDPRYDSSGTSVSLVAEIPKEQNASGPDNGGRIGGGIAVGGGFLWIAAPPTTVIRVAETDLRRRLAVTPDSGVEGAIVYHDGAAWAAGANQVVPIDAASGIPSTEAIVGVVRDVSYGDGSLWVVSGGPAHADVAQALRRVDPVTRLVQATIGVGSDPVSVAAAAGSVWVADRTDGTIERVDTAHNRVAATIRVSGKPTALSAGTNGVWVAAR
jgi:hypothetical protein